MAEKARGQFGYVPDGASASFGGIYDGSGADPYSRPNLEAVLRRPSFLGPTVSIGNQRYRQEDRGRANVLVPITGPLPSAEEIQRRLDALGPIWEQPFAGAAYGIASASGASPEMRDKLTALAGGINEVVAGAAPFGARSRGVMVPPVKGQPVAPLRRAAIVYGELDGDGRATGADAIVTPPLLRTGTRVKRGLVTPGLPPKGTRPRQDRGHLAAGVLGGTANTAREAVTLHEYTNRGPMNNYEQMVKRRVESGETVNYFVRPLYEGNAKSPSLIVMSAHGSRGDFTPRIVRNAPRIKK